MLLEDFEELVSTMQASYKMMDKVYNFIKVEKVFANHCKTIDILLNQIYQKEAVACIFYNWLAGNRNPIAIPIEDGTEIIQPCETIRDLYICMEAFRLDSGITNNTVKLESKSEGSVDSQEKV